MFLIIIIHTFLSLPQDGNFRGGGSTGHVTLLSVIMNLGYLVRTPNTSTTQKHMKSPVIHAYLM